MADKYPSLSPYNYCADNPVILVDPDGREISDDWFVNHRNGHVIYVRGAKTIKDISTNDRKILLKQGCTLGDISNWENIISDKELGCVERVWAYKGYSEWIMNKYGYVKADILEIEERVTQFRSMEVDQTFYRTEPIVTRTKENRIKNSYVKKSDIGRKNNVKNYDKSRFNKEVTITSFKVKVRPGDIYRGDNYTHGYRLGNSIDKGGNVLKNVGLWKIILRLF